MKTNIIEMIMKKKEVAERRLRTYAEEILKIRKYKR